MGHTSYYHHLRTTCGLYTSNNWNLTKSSPLDGSSRYQYFTDWQYELQLNSWATTTNQQHPTEPLFTLLFTRIIAIKTWTIHKIRLSSAGISFRIPWLFSVHRRQKPIKSIVLLPRRFIGNRWNHSPWLFRQVRLQRQSSLAAFTRLPEALDWKV